MEPDEDVRAHMRMNIQSLHSFGFILTFVLFAGALVGFAVVGAVVGPNVLVEHVASDVDLSRDLWSGTVTDLSKLNQQILLSVQIQNKQQGTGLSGDITFLLSLELKGSLPDSLWIPQEQIDGQVVVARTHTISCDAGEEFCGSVVISHEPFITQPNYRYNISLAGANDTTTSFLGNCTFTVAFINDQFTLFELWFRFALLLCTAVVLVIFAHKLKGFAWADWTVEQKWTTLLLVGLFAWNNPFFPLGLLINHWIPAFIDALMVVSFLILLLLYWLIMFDGIHRPASERTWFFYFPKFLILTTLWGVTIAVFTMMGLRELDDPSSTLDNIPYYFVWKVIMIVLVVIYALYLAYVVCRAFGTMISKRSSPLLGSRVIFFNVFTLVIFLLTLAGFIAGYISPLVKSNSAEFLAFLSLYNLYVFTLAFVYLPNTRVATNTLGSLQYDGMIELEDTEAKLTSHISDNDDDDAFGINLESDSDSDSL